ncbi:MAG: hypothetical protein LBD49_02290 [Oscillospiraceae bacterium]|jgi:ribosomal protein L7Ae-like RNA K-turn-binding protein|nr:hypothetical protein [Oscillospiraceae bacterium]
MNKALNLIGIAKKAGLLEIGGESVDAAARRGRARLILSAADASDASKRRARALAARRGAAYAELDVSKTELAAAIGRGLPGVLAVTDAGLAFGIASRLSERDPGAYSELAEGLREGAARTLARRRAALARKRGGGKCAGGKCGGTGCPKRAGSGTTTAGRLNK